MITPIKAFEDNYIWLGALDNRSTFCVDPGDAKPVIDYLTVHQLKLELILLTHHHADHSGGIEKLIKLYPEVRVCGPKDHRLPKSYYLDDDNAPIEFHSLKFSVLHTPGHTATHISFFEPNKAWLFCGDTLFSAGCGRIFDGTALQLFASLELIRKLPDNTQIFCAHEYTRQNLRFAQTIEPENDDVHAYYQALMQSPLRCSLPSTLAIEKKVNPFLRTHYAHLQQGKCSAELPSETKALLTLKHLRQQKDNF
ncbi:MAG: hydroxyacylglutathione hydrolase [Legionellaceae bacterium]|nr:hydroxyacylglutathione hydrolase [Legionellaceae bacterium]HCA88925.1 hydroxyacylglutathione hydrolase [Legionellales bacterium]|tara:strand:- start:77 stop:835 length:759 start_codon:yes stop_codon:yes gene_type:complete